MTDDNIINIIINDRSVKELTNIEASNLNRILTQLKLDGLIELNGSQYYEPYEQSITLTKFGEDFLYLNKTYSEYVYEKFRPMKNIFNIETLNANSAIIGNSGTNINITNNSPDNVIEALNNAIESIKHNQNMEQIFKAKLVDTYTELLLAIQTSKESKLPIFDNLISIATNIIGLLGVGES